MSATRKRANAGLPARSGNLIEPVSRLGTAATLPMERVLVISGKPPIKRVQVDRVLESAVVLSWSDLVKGSHRGIIHVEYGTAPEPSLQYLKVWLSTSLGTWDLICEYWISPGSSRVPASGLTFSNGYYSSDLKQMLGQLMRHQESLPDLLSGKSGVSLIRIQPPTEDDKRQAGTCMREAYHRLGLASPNIPYTAS